MVVYGSLSNLLERLNGGLSVLSGVPSFSLRDGMSLNVMRSEERIRRYMPSRD